MKYTVIREHLGDRKYAEGETRIADAADVRHLVPHVLQPEGRAVKAEEVNLNKADPLPANKSKSGRKAENQA